MAVTTDAIVNAMSICNIIYTYALVFYQIYWSCISSKTISHFQDWLREFHCSSVLCWEKQFGTRREMISDMNFEYFNIADAYRDLFTMFSL